MIEFQGQFYFDDRLYVLYLCKVTAEIKSDGFISTAIYHEEALDNYRWCIVTYRNCSRYPVFSTKLFDSKDEANAYIRKIEPETPLISLNGKSPSNSASYEEYLCWKKNNNFKEYDYRTMYTLDGNNPKEIIFQTFKQFLSSNPDFLPEFREKDRYDVFSGKLW